MKHNRLLSFFVLYIVVISSFAASAGIFSSGGPGRTEHPTVRGSKVILYGDGLYRHMSADVAIQGIAQDYVTLFAAVPLLIISFIFARRGSVKGTLSLMGLMLYFFLTYLFYTAMAMYNKMFLAYVTLITASLFSLILLLVSFDYTNFSAKIKSEKIYRAGGIFLIVNASLIMLLWLSIVVPPLLDGTVIPAAVEHYTTLVVQGFDLGIFLPLAFASGYLALRRSNFGYVFVNVYMIFLSVLMSALVSKIVFMAMAGANVFPVIFIMPVIAISAGVFSLFLLRNVLTGSKM